MLIGFRVIAVIIVFSGSLLEFTTAWSIADILMGIMALINIPVILVLGKRAIRCGQDYVAQRGEGRNPVFRAEDIGIREHTDFWQ